MTTPEALADQQAKIDALSQYPHALHFVDFATDYNGKPERASLDSANLFSSEIIEGEHAGKHTVAIDLDVPARLVPSSTPGHSHLYIDVPMSWLAYNTLLAALSDAGVIQEGYYAASEPRQFTTLRLPWVKKDVLDYTMKCVGCRKRPSQIKAYNTFARDADGNGVSNAEYVKREEGTLNRSNGHFYCDACYIRAGQPLGVAA